MLELHSCSPVELPVLKSGVSRPSTRLSIVSLSTTKTESCPAVDNERSSARLVAQGFPFAWESSSSRSLLATCLPVLRFLWELVTSTVGKLFSDADELCGHPSRVELARFSLDALARAAAVTLTRQQEGF